MKRPAVAALFCFLLPAIVHAQSWVCMAHQAAGFAFDKPGKEWRAAIHCHAGNGAGSLSRDARERVSLPALGRHAPAGDALEELAALFRADAPKQLGALWRAITEGDAYALREAAHRFRSSLDNLGARHMSELCERLEALGREGATEGSAALMAELDREYERVRDALDPPREPPPQAADETRK